eukprot:TRINITY_DN2027_c0_g2_i1.p1 TRINITY_DN2027_c0_g2~~TRINITY_DN2027_c0_g2_i1.p1  ORF type:complete len:339 (+),score=71.51 TRINITY_DN2027_c0_g2_i1:138-1154(+)
MTRSLIILIFLFFLLNSIYCVNYDTTPIEVNLENLNLNIDSEVAVAGISAGACFATQMHISFSSKIKYLGFVAGVPYYCANNNVLIATTICMVTPNTINLNELYLATTYAETLLSIDKTKNLKDSSIYLFSGTKDTVVNSDAVKKTESYYKHYGVSDIKAEYNIAAEHSWVTYETGNSCDTLGTPFINNCSYSINENMISHFYGSVNRPTEAVKANLFTFSQGNFTPQFVLPNIISLDNTGYIYIPTACQKGIECRLIVNFHGCEQGYQYIGTTYIYNNKMNNYAENNNIIVLYPQVIKSSLNPNGCFDWWGYTSPAYATKLGLQMSTVNEMIEALTK